jgi:hypothetical protein
MGLPRTCGRAARVGGRDRHLVIVPQARARTENQHRFRFALPLALGDADETTRFHQIPAKSPCPPKPSLKRLAPNLMERHRKFDLSSAHG